MNNNAIRTVVVGYDASDEAERALMRAGTLGAACGANVVVVSVARLVGPGGPRGLGGVDPVDSLEGHEAALDFARAKLADTEVTAEFVLAVGEPADSIVEVAEEKNADVIVVGARDLGLLQRMLGQSVSEGVLHNTEADVLIVH